MDNLHCPETASAPLAAGTPPSHEQRVLDLVHLARQTFGDRELERELLMLFEGQCRRLVPIVSGAGTPVERGDAAHTLKGAARAVGAWRIAQVADRVEAVLAGKSPEEDLDALLADLERAVRETGEAARRLSLAA